MPVQPSKSSGAPPYTPDPDQEPPTKDTGESGARTVSTADTRRRQSSTESGYESDPSNKSLSERSTSLSSQSSLPSDDGSDTLDSPEAEKGQFFFPEQSHPQAFAPSRPYQIDHEPFAHGNFGQIYHVRQEKVLPKKTQPFHQQGLEKEKEKDEDNHFALKTGLSGSDFDHEHSIMELLPFHKNIVRYEGRATLEGTEGLLFEYIDGPKVDDLITKLCRAALPADMLFNAIKYLEQQRLEAVAHTHDNDVVHADLKSDNFLFHKPTQELKLLDFGMSAKVDEPVHCGHELFTPPEALDAIQGKRAGGIKAQKSIDCYAVGQTFHRNLDLIKGGNGRYFKAGIETNDITYGDRAAKAFILKNAMKKYTAPNADGSYKTALPIPDEESKTVEELYDQELIRINQQHVESDLRGYQWEPEGFEKFHNSAMQFPQEVANMTRLTNSLMHPDPDQRMTAAQALQHQWFTTNPVDPKKAIKTINKFL